MPDDAAALSQLVCSLGDYFLADPDRPEDAARFFEDMSVEATRQRLDNPDYRGFVAEVQGQVVGMIILFEARHLYQLFVDPAWLQTGFYWVAVPAPPFPSRTAAQQFQSPRSTT